MQKSRYLVDCENVFIRSRAYNLQAPHNATHFRATRNALIMITNGSFRNASRLIYLDLSNNWLRKIGHNAFAALRSLTVLDLSHNILLVQLHSCSLCRHFGFWTLIYQIKSIPLSTLWMEYST